MAEALSMVSARVEDMPVLLAHLHRMGGQPLLDEHVPTHGHWVGLSLGWVSVGWVTHLLSEGDHRLNHVTPWATPRLHTLQACTGQAVDPLDVSDDRLATVLEVLSEETPWRACEGALNQHTRRVSDLPPACVRLDRTTANGHWSVTEDGLCQCGHRKDHRPDLPQVKIMVSALEPLGLPVATDIVPGQRADAPWYSPAIARVREGLGRRGLLYVGDGQMGAVETRASIHAGGDDDLCPLSERHLPPAVLADSWAPVWAEEQAWTVMHRAQPGGQAKLIAEGFERRESVTAAMVGQRYNWQERRWVMRSCQLAQAAARERHGRLAKAQAEITALQTRGRGRRRWTEPSARREAVEAILAHERVSGLLAVRYRAPWWEHPGRRDGGRDATVRLEWDVKVTVRVDQAAVAAVVRQLGWRVDVTTHPPAQLSLPEAVLAYRHESWVERAMGRLNGRPLSLPPMSLEREDHATGLIRLWSLGWRVLTRLEFEVRRHLAAAQTTLAGLSVGNPQRATMHPTAARLLEAFHGLTLTIIRAGRRCRRHLTPLAHVQQRILERLDFPVTISTKLCPNAHKPP